MPTLITPRRTVTLLVSLIVAAFLAPTAIAQDMDTIGPLPSDGVWRLTGTFNNWNTNDDRYRLVRNEDGTFEIRKQFPAGRHEFKFVRNGRWDDGHAGWTHDGSSSLTQPGGNIVIELDHPTPLRIVLETRTRSWYRQVSVLDAAAPIADLVGASIAGRPIVIDMQWSLPREGRSIVDSRITGPDDITIVRETADSSRWLVTAEHAGRYELMIAVSDGDWSDEERFILNVDEAYEVMLDFDTDQVLSMSPMSDGRHVVVTAPLDLGPVHIGVFSHDHSIKAAPVRIAVREGEQLAITYDPKLRHTDVRPGRFALQINEDDMASLEQLSATPFHDPRRSDHVVAISEQPPLADVYAYASPNVTRENVTLVLHGKDGHERRVPMRRESTAAGERWQARVMFDSPRPTYEIEYQTRVGLRRDRHTAVLRPAVDTPDWAKGAVWYQIFPERFANGDPANDPRGIGVFMKDWKSDWYATPADEFKAWAERVKHFGGNPDEWDRARNGSGPPGSPGRDRLYNVIWDRRYGGDLQGVLDRLDHIADLGITAIYFNPVFHGQSMHKYDATDYRHIDPHFGPWDPEGDAEVLRRETLDPTTWGFTAADRFFIEEFLPACHERGIRVIVDGVFNHTGRDFFGFVDLLEHGADSEFAEWYNITLAPDGSVESWAAWDGHSGWLPEFRQQSDRNLVEPVREHLFAVTRRWLDPNGDGDPSDGIDGFRLDVPLEVGDPFWREWRRVVKQTNPEAYIVSEIWHEASGWLRGDMFDAQMNYPFGSAVVEWAGVKPGMDTAELHDRLIEAFEDDHPATQLVQQNLYNSHDTDRVASQLHNPGRAFDEANRPQDNGPNYRGERPPDRSFDLVHPVVAFLATYKGAPMIYYGEELGMWGADDPTNRKPMTWPDLLPFEREDERVLPDLHRYYRAWLPLRHANPALRYGSVRRLDVGSDRVFAFVRELNGDRLLVVINAGDSAVKVDGAVLLDEDVTLTPVHVDGGIADTIPARRGGVWRVRAD
jgi:cyclomaltodextrinase